MATYDQLLIGAGGGIVNRHQQSDQQQGATVAIGIGGTGASALSTLKREVYRKIKPDNPDSAVPSYKNIKFFLIDSDKSKLEGHTDLMDLDLRTEYFDISSHAVKKNFASKDFLKGKPELDWLDYEHITVKEAGADGAGGIRQVGRFLLFQKAQSLHDQLRLAITGAMKGVPGGELSIHVFSGLAGGTGGGCFIDVCYILRQVLSELGKDDVRINGYFFMPDVNLSIPSIAANPRIAGFIQANGYAALQELDYLMDLGNNGDYFEQNYNAFSIRSELPPVDLCYLISTTQTDGTLVENGYEYAMSVVTDYVLDFLSRVELPEGLEAGKTDGGQTLNGHIANLEQAKAGIKKMHGASVDYNIIGASDATMPLSDITTYLGTKLFDVFSVMWNQVPTAVELNDFVTKSQMDFNNIVLQLTKGIVWRVNFPDYDNRALRDGTGIAVERANSWLANARGIMEKNFKTLTEDLQGYQIPGSSTSLIGRTFRQLHDLYAVNYEKGPFMAARILAGRNNRNLLHIIDGYIEKTDVHLTAELKQADFLQAGLEKAKANLNRANFINLSAKCKDYLNCLNRHYIHMAKVRQYNVLLELLRRFRKQIVQLNDDFFQVLTTVLDTLQNTFKENANILTNGVRTENQYTWRILSIPDIKESLDESVARMDVGQVTQDFIDNMFAEYKNWLGQDPNQIRKLVSDFVVSKFDNITRQTFLDYLKIKFDTTDSTRLQERIKTEIIQNKLADRSEPMFWCSPMFSIADVARNCVLSVPFNVPEIVQAAEDFGKDDSQFTIRRTGLTDRMFMMRFYSGMPLYAYQELQMLERAYESDSKTGRHLYGTPKKDWSKILPSPIPASFRIDGYQNERLERINAQLREEFQQAKERGIIYQDNDQWLVVETKTDGWEDVVNEIMNSQIQSSKDVAGVRDLNLRLMKLEGDMKKPQNQKIVTLSICGAHSQYVENVLMDNYFRYPVLNQKVSKELEKRKRLKEAEERVEQLLAGVGIDEKFKERFFSAVFTGCIQMLSSKFVYSYEEYGIETTIDLQNAKMPYSRCGVYQAYLTYLDLDDEIKKRIDEDTMERMDRMDEEIYNCAVKIRQRYDKNLLKMILTTVEVDPKYGEIEFFFKEFIKALQTFLQMYK